MTTRKWLFSQITEKSVVTVINGSRRPIRRVTCELNTIDGKAHESRINALD
jgi:hypothetical protein